MEAHFSYSFGSLSVLYFTFFGIAFVGFALGFGFWIDFRRRFAQGGALGGTIVWVCGTMLGLFFGYAAMQPEYFRSISVNPHGIRMNYPIPFRTLEMAWSQVSTIDIYQHRLIITDKNGVKLSSPVVYKGDQARLLRSVQSIRP